jgi:cell division protein YceG involved in septum cleavage
VEVAMKNDKTWNLSSKRVPTFEEEPKIIIYNNILVKQVVFFTLCFLTILLYTGYHFIVQHNKSEDKQIYTEGSFEPLGTFGIESLQMQSFSYNLNVKPFKTASNVFVPLQDIKIIQKTALELSHVNTASEVLPERESKSITIPEGFNVSQLAEYLNKNNIVNKEDFLSKINDHQFYQSLAKKYSVLPKTPNEVRYLFEGYLLGGSYDIFVDSTSEELIEKIVSSTNDYIKKLSDSFNIAGNLTAQDVINIASIVEKESDLSSDRKKIASVFYNRLNRGMKLQSDVTVLYALGDDNRRVLYKDLKVESLFNTYYVEGLPIGPITSPSKDALLASFNPSNTNYYYFFGVGTRTKFSVDYEQHVTTIATNKKTKE